MYVKHIPLAPFAKARPRFSGHAYNDETYKQKKRDFKMLFGYVPEYTIIKLTVIAIRPIPKSTSKKKRAAMLGTYATPSPDADNVWGAVMDSLWPRNDNIVVDGGCCKVWGNAAGMIIIIEEVGNAPALPAYIQEMIDG